MTATDPRRFSHVIGQAIESLDDVRGAIRAAERQLLEPGDDAAATMTGAARVLAVIGRVVEAELGELEKLRGEDLLL